MVNLKEKTILITGGNGFIGHFVIENLLSKRGVDPKKIIIPKKETDDIRRIENCLRLLKNNNVDLVIHLAALVGGVGYSSKFPATQYYNNILMDLNIVEATRQCGVAKILLVGSSCAYPESAGYPLTEDQLWQGLPQKTNLAYGIAKRILTIQAKAYHEEYNLNVQVVIPNNAYGPGDNFHPEYSHVIPSLIRKCVSGENPLMIWGDGTSTRDFLYVKDFAEGVVLAAEKLETGEPVNLGSGIETRISDLVDKIKKLTDYHGEIVYDDAKPNGQPVRSVNIDKAKKILNFLPHFSLEEGLKETIAWYQSTLI